MKRELKPCFAENPRDRWCSSRVDGDQSGTSNYGGFINPKKQQETDNTMLNDKFDSKNNSSRGDYVLLDTEWEDEGTSTQTTETTANDNDDEVRMERNVDTGDIPVASKDSATESSTARRNSLENATNKTPPADITPNTQAVATDFSVGSRGQVNGAAAIFGATGIILGGPILGIVAAAGSAHLAANKRGDAAEFARRCGAYLDNFGRDRKQAERDTGDCPSQTSKSSQNPSGSCANANKAKNLWDKITDELVKLAEWTERKIKHTA